MEEIKAKVRQFLSRFFRHSNLRDDEDFFALGYVNSLFSMQLVMFVEKEFGLTVENQDLNLANFSSVDAIAALVQRRQSQAGD